MDYLFDTNIFLEILLDQAKKDVCKNLLNKNIGKIYLTDFSLHSIGVILLRQKKIKVLDHFLKDILPHSTILSLPKEKYSDITDIASKYKLDFDDTYQLLIAIEFEIGILTMDKDFSKITKLIPVSFI
jgi:uncharacterized protein